MKKLISLSIALFFCQGVMAQENPVKNDFLFENPVTKEKIKIETGNKVSIRFKIPNVKITGTILSFSDSSLTVGVRREPFRQIVPFRNIANMTVIAIVATKKRYIITVTLKSGEKLKGELIHTMQDSLSILKTSHSQLIRIAASEIKSIRIYRKRAPGRAVGIGAALGSILGLSIGFGTYTKPGYCAGAQTCIDFGPPRPLIGALIGALGGAFVGLAIGPVPTEYKTEGDPGQFNMFVNQFKK
jgi:hypothetical protein